MHRSFIAFLPAPTNMPNIGIVMYEDASQSLVSDQLWVQQGFWYFASDPDLVDFHAAGISLVGALVEDGTQQDVSEYFGLPPNSMSVMSDVPEPASGLLLGLAGGLLFFLQRQRARRA